MFKRRATGFTLIELMVTIAVAAILLAIALPSFQGALRSNRVATASNEVLASLSLARTEAIRGIGPAGVCPSTNGTSCAVSTDWAAGWTVWREDPAAGGGPPVRSVVRYVQPKQRTTVTGPGGGIEFNTQGRAESGAAQIGVVPSDAATPARCIRVGVTGQARVEQGVCA